MELVEGQEFADKREAVNYLESYALGKGFLTRINTDNRTEGRPCIRVTCQRARKTYPPKKKLKIFKGEDGTEEGGGGDELWSEVEEVVDMVGIGGAFDPKYVDVGAKRGTHTVNATRMQVERGCPLQRGVNEVGYRETFITAHQRVQPQPR